MDANEIALRSCPFCGSDNLNEYTDMDHYHTVECAECGGRMQRYAYHKDGEQPPVYAAWNRRPEDAA